MDSLISGAEEERTRLIEQMDRERKAEITSIEERYKAQIEQERKIHEIDIERLMKKLKETETVKVERVEITKNENDTIITEMRERWKAELAAEQLKHSQELERVRASIKDEVERARNEEKTKYEMRKEQTKQLLNDSAKEANKKKLAIVVQRLQDDSDSKIKKINDDAARKVSQAQSEIIKIQQQLEDEKAKNQRQVMTLEATIADEKQMNGRLERENERLVHEIEDYKVTIKNLHNEISTKDKLIQDTMKTVEQRESSTKSRLEEEIENLKSQVADAKAVNEEDKLKWAAEKDAIIKKYEDEQVTLSKRVKSIIEQKESIIADFKERLAEAQKRLREADEIFHMQKKTIQTTKQPRKSTNAKPDLEIRATPVSTRTSSTNGNNSQNAMSVRTAIKGIPRASGHKPKTSK